MTQSKTYNTKFLDWIIKETKLNKISQLEAKEAEFVGRNHRFFKGQIPAQPWTGLALLHGPYSGHGGLSVFWPQYFKPRPSSLQQP